MKFLNKYKIYIGIVLVIISVMIVNSLTTGDPIEIMTGQQETYEENENFIYVDIKGEVKNPGVYKLENDSRIFQLISKAGGLTQFASTKGINLSSKLKDEEVVYIPNETEIADVENPFIKNDDTNDGLKININQAPVELLDTLPGIGLSTAQNIIDYIETNGYFDGIHDITNVTGIGESTFEKIKDYITVD